MNALPPEDQPDAVKVGPVTVPIIDNDDPRFDEDRSAWSAARARAAAMHSADQLLLGVEDDDWRVRHEAIPRLAARAPHDERTPQALIRRLAADPQWEVRDLAAMTLAGFQSRRVIDALLAAENDPHAEVRWSVQFVLSQFGLRSSPHDS